MTMVNTTDEVSRVYDNNFWLRERCVNADGCVALDYDDGGILT